MVLLRESDKKRVWIGRSILIAIFILASVIIWLNADRVNSALNSKKFENVKLKVSFLEEELYTLRKSGDTIGVSGTIQQYRYVRDGKKYVLIYDDFYGLNEDDGEWVEYTEEEYGGYDLFDFSVFNHYSKTDLKKEGDYYIPKEDPNEFYCDFFSIKKKEVYTDCDIRFYIDNGKIRKIVANCIYNGETEIGWVYEFSYKKQKIQVPGADVQYEDTIKN